MRHVRSLRPVLPRLPNAEAHRIQANRRVSVRPGSWLGYFKFENLIQ